MNIETTAEPIREGLPSLPKGKMLSGMDMESLHVLYTAGQMQDYAHAALAARAAAPVSGQGANLADDGEFTRLCSALAFCRECNEDFGAHKRAIADYVSRPRSEDSRAKQWISARDRLPEFDFAANRVSQFVKVIAALDDGSVCAMQYRANAYTKEESKPTWEFADGRRCLAHHVAYWMLMPAAPAALASSAAPADSAQGEG